jgi:hypothetical protein
MGRHLARFYDRWEVGIIYRPLMLTLTISQPVAVGFTSTTAPEPVMYPSSTMKTEVAYSTRTSPKPV